MKRTDAIAFGLALIGGLGSFLIADRVFERLPHLEDEFALLWEAEVMADGKVSLPSPEAADSFLVPFVVDYDGQRFGKYPPGWPAALSVASRLGATWLANAVFAGLSIWLTYRLGLKLMGAKVGLLAAFLTLLSPMFLVLSGSLLAHTFSIFLSLAFMLGWLDLFASMGEDLGESSVPRWVLILITGLSLGLLGITRPLTAVAIALPFSVHASVFWRRVGREGRVNLLLVGGLVITITMLLPIWQTTLTGDPTRNLYTLWWEYDRLGFGPGIGVAEGGHNLKLAILNTQWNLRAGVHDLFGWPYISWIFLPFGILAMGRSWRPFLVFSTFPVLVFVYMFYWVGSWIFGPRYYSESMPALAIASAGGIWWLFGWLERRAAYARVSKLALSVLVMLLLVGNVIYYLPPRMGMVYRLNNISRDRIETFEELGVERGLVIVHPVESWWDSGALLLLTPPFADSSLILAISRGSAADEALISTYSDLSAYHYYPDEPNDLYDSPR